jgi:hypothetical protein
MCFTLYIGTPIKLPLIEWKKDQPGVHATNLKEYELGVLSRFSLPNVLYIGSDQGCGCGFRHALAEGKEWLSVVENDQDALKAIQKNHIDLWQYLTCNLTAGSVEIYACWNGDVNDCPDCVSDIKMENIINEDFYFKEGWLYKVAVQPT